MRKILAVTLAVLMLASLLLVLPISAATPADGTTEADIPTLMVTEMVSNSSSGIKIGDSTKEYDAFEYIELYNRSDSEINLYDYSILRSPFFTNAPSSGLYVGTWNKWKSTQKFTQKMNIVSGDITTKPNYVELIDAFSNVELKNPADLRIAARSNAVIFVVTKTTLEALSTYMSNLGGLNTNTDILRTLFRNYYKVPATVPIYMVWGYGDAEQDALGNTVAATDMFNLSDCTSKTMGFMYGISTNDFNIDDEKGYDKTTHTINPKIACLFAYGASVYGHTGTTQNQNQSVIYAPANTTPVLWNARNEYRKSNVGTFTDYFASAAIPSIVSSYRECAMMLNAMKPTCGTMPAYQWYYVDAEHAPAEMKAAGTDWGDKAVADFVAVRFPNLEEEADNYQPAEGEPDVELDFVDRQTLTDRFFGNKNKKNPTETKNFPIGAIIGIIAGGVVVLGGIAALVIVLVMRKKKAAAAADATEVAPDASSDASPEQNDAQPTENAGEDHQD